MNLRQAAQQALEALESAEDQLAKPYSNQAQRAITALRAALAEPEQEPDGISWLKRDSGYFTAPTPRKPLTDELERKSDAIQRLWKERDELRSECRVLVRQNGEWQEAHAELVEALTTCVMAMQDYQAGIGITEMFDKGERMGRAVLLKVEASK